MKKIVANVEWEQGDEYSIWCCALSCMNITKSSIHLTRFSFIKTNRLNPAKFFLHNELFFSFIWMLVIYYVMWSQLSQEIKNDCYKWHPFFNVYCCIDQSSFMGYVTITVFSFLYFPSFFSPPSATIYPCDQFPFLTCFLFVDDDNKIGSNYIHLVN